MLSNHEITIGRYMQLLESVGNRSENRVCARFVYLTSSMAREVWNMRIEPSQVFSTIINLKARFEKQGHTTKIHLSMSRHGSTDDKANLLTTGQACALHNSNPGSTLEPWVILYEWYTKQCLAVQIDGVKLRKASCVIESSNLWLMDQEASVSELAMRRVWDDMGRNSNQ